LIVLALIVLGVYVDSLPPRPRCTIPLQPAHSVDFLSPDGRVMITSPDPPP
jgi:hypothetical protein